MAALNHERQGVCIYCKGQQGFIRSKNALTHRGLWLWLIDHEIPRSEIDEQPGLCLVAKTLTRVTTIKSHASCSLSRLKSVRRCGVLD